MRFDSSREHISDIIKFMKKLDPKAVWLFFINFVFTGGVPLIILFTWLSIFVGDLSTENTLSVFNKFSYALWVIVPLYLVFYFIWAKLTYRFYKYELTQDGFRKELGVIYKKYVTIPYDRIQNVDINRGILARILGLSDLNIQTAGASTAYLSEGRLPGLSMQDEEELRDELIRRAKSSKSQGL